MSIKKILLCVTIACIIIPLIIAIILFFYLPDIIPTHLSINGTIDRYGNKAEIFIVPFANILIVLMFVGFFKLMIEINDDENTAKTQRVVDISAIATYLTFLGLYVWYFIHICPIVFGV